MRPVSTIIGVIGLAAAMSSAAEAEAPLTPSEIEGTHRYCDVMYEVNSYPPEKKQAHCNCVMAALPALRPASRQAIILVGENAKDLTKATLEIDAMIGTHSPEEQQAILDEMDEFLETKAAQCRKNAGLEP